MSVHVGEESNNKFEQYTNYIARLKLITNGRKITIPPDMFYTSRYPSKSEQEEMAEKLNSPFVIIGDKINVNYIRLSEALGFPQKLIIPDFVDGLYKDSFQLSYVEGIDYYILNCSTICHIQFSCLMEPIDIIGTITWLLNVQIPESILITRAQYNLLKESRDYHDLFKHSGIDNIQVYIR